MEGFTLLEPAWINWYILAFVLMSLELLSPGVLLFWFGLGALATAISSQLFGLESWQLTTVLFAIFSMLSVLVGKKVMKSFSSKSSGKDVLNKRLQQYVGRVATLETDLINGRGRIRLDDTFWTVHGPDLPVGSKVVITRTDDSILFVEQATGAGYKVGNYEN